ncbi:hypothetical protein BGY98DRAFT_146429 [Russula aff. rugulosa BPL654]|nr:hypothetical protein BGY98DRAFT_146429 [Russula aff. rugulosa BPL654]
MKSGEHVVLVGQDHSFEVLQNMQGLQCGIALDSSSTQEGLPAVLIQIGRRMLLAKVRFALLFSTVAFRIAEIDCRSAQGNILLISPAFWLSSEPPEEPGTPLLEAKPLPALFTAMVLAGLRQPVIHPAACDLERLGPIFLNSPASNDMSSSGTGDSTTSHSGVSREQVLAFSYKTTGVSPTVRLLRRTRVQPYQQGISRRSLIPSLPNSSPDLPSPKQSVLFLAHCPTRLDYPSQDIASYYTSTSCMRAASRLGVGPSIRRHACSPNFFSTRTWHLRTARRAHTNISFPSHTSRASSSPVLGNLYVPRRVLCHRAGGYRTKAEKLPRL